MKIIRCCQLLISLLPQRIYHALTQEDTITVITVSDESEVLTIKKCFTKIEKYKESTAVSEQERKLLAQSAMQVGLSNGSTVNDAGNNKIKKPPITKKNVTKKKVTVGKGAIDGFFKKR